MLQQGRTHGRPAGVQDPDQSFTGRFLQCLFQQTVLQFQAVFRTVNHPAQQRRQAGVVPFQIGQQLPGRILARSRHDLRCHLQAGTPVLHGSFRSLPGKHTVHLIQDVRIHRGQPADMLQQQ